jgi:hypothetical protein
MNAQLVPGEAGSVSRGGFILVEACPRALVACPRAFSPGAGMRRIGLFLEPLRLRSGGAAIAAIVAGARGLDRHTKAVFKTALVYLGQKF